MCQVHLSRLSARQVFICKLNTGRRVLFKQLRRLRRYLGCEHGTCIPKEHNVGFGGGAVKRGRWGGFSENGIWCWFKVKNRWRIWKLWQGVKCLIDQWCFLSPETSNQLWWADFGFISASLGWCCGTFQFSSSKQMIPGANTASGLGASPFPPHAVPQQAQRADDNLRNREKSLLTISNQPTWHRHRLFSGIWKGTSKCSSPMFLLFGRLQGSDNK